MIIQNIVQENCFVSTYVTLTIGLKLQAFRDDTNVNSP